MPATCDVGGPPASASQQTRLARRSRSQRASSVGLLVSGGRRIDCTVLAAWNLRLRTGRSTLHRQLSAVICRCVEYEVRRRMQSSHYAAKSNQIDMQADKQTIRKNTHTKTQ